MQTTIDPSEVAKFEAMAAEWWNPNGKFRPLHLMNPCRLDYITGQIAAEYGRDLTKPLPFAGLRILDIGCGGGLLSEPMARLGAEVVGAAVIAALELDRLVHRRRIRFINHRPRRHLADLVFAGLSGFLVLSAGLAVLGDQLGIEVVLAQCVSGIIHYQNDFPAVSAIAAIGATARDKFFPTK